MKRLPRLHVGSIFQQNSGFAVVGQIRIENLVAHSLAQHFIAQGHEHFDAFVKVARHPVGAADIYLFLTIIGEIENAAVFEEAAHNAPHSYVIAHPANSGAKRADAADQQINLHSGLRCAVERLNDVLIEQRIHLGNDASIPPVASVLRLPVNERNNFLRQIEWRHQKRLVTGVFGVCSQETKNIMNRAGDLRIRGEQAQVSINPRRGRVVVTGSDVGVTSGYTIRIVPHQQREFTVSF